MEILEKKETPIQEPKKMECVLVPTTEVEKIINILVEAPLPLKYGLGGIVDYLTKLPKVTVDTK